VIFISEQHISLPQAPDSFPVLRVRSWCFAIFIEIGSKLRERLAAEFLAAKAKLNELCLFLADLAHFDACLDLAARSLRVPELFCRLR